jgi:hypothetical protein
MNRMWRYKVAYWFYAAIAFLCLCGVMWVAFKSGWAWYWRLLAYFFLVPTGWEAIKLALHALRLEAFFSETDDTC